MKMNLNMTFEEGKKIIEALRECAINNGWDKDELDECGVMEEYTSAVDAALTAMGISVDIASEPEDDDENKYCDSAADCYFCNSDDEEWDEDEEGGYFNSDYEDEDEDCQYSLTPKGEFVVKYMEAGYPLEEALKVADILFGEGE